MPHEPPKPPANGRTVAIVGSVSVATAIFAVVAQWEGKENTAYRDAVNIITICYGDTANVRMGQTETDAQCAERLDRQVAAHIAPVLRCTPSLARPEHANRLIAAASFTYNLGGPTYCQSSIARLFNAGRYREGCEFLMRYNRAGGRVLNGLTNRRRNERAICLRGL